MGRVRVCNDFFSLSKENINNELFEGKEKKFGSGAFGKENKFLLILASSNAGEMLDDRQVFIAFHEDSSDFLMYYEEQSCRDFLPRKL